MPSATPTMTPGHSSTDVVHQQQHQQQQQSHDSHSQPSSLTSSSQSPLASLAAHWKACTGDIPPPLVGASINIVDDVDPSKVRMYLFGGRLVSNRQMVNDLYELNVQTLEWTRLSPMNANTAGPSNGRLRQPQPRYFHSSNLWQGKIIVFGGMGYVNGQESNDLCVLNEVVAYDINLQRWEFDFIKPSTMTPQPRYAHLSAATSESSIIIIGGQDMANKYVEEINILDLKLRQWTHKQVYRKQRGSYRSLAVESQWSVAESDALLEPVKQQQQSNGLQRSALASANEKAGGLLSTSNMKFLPMSVQVRDEKGNLKPFPVYLYTNYNFTDVKREMEVVQTEGDPLRSLSIEDRSKLMNGVNLPPGLRFPTGAILGSHLIISGTYLANTSQTFAIWALHIPTLHWSRLDVGPLLATGSWNRGVLWSQQNRLVIFGHRGRDLVADYNHRQTNWDHVLMIEMEAWGITQAPQMPMTVKAIQLGLKKLASTTVGSYSTALQSGMGPLDSRTEKPLWSYGGRGDFEIVCSDGMRLGCDRAILEKRWPWFAKQMREYHQRIRSTAKGLAKRNGASMTPGLEDLLEEEDQDRSRSPRSVLSLSRADPRITPRHLLIDEEAPVMLALLVYLYTGCFCTQMQQHPAIIATMLIVSRVYEMRDLERWTKHAAHVVMSRMLAPPPSAQTPASVMPPTEGLIPPERHRYSVAIYEAATLSGFEALQIRSLRIVMSIAKWIQKSNALTGHEEGDSSFDAPQKSDLSHSNDDIGYSHSATPAAAGQSEAAVNGNRKAAKMALEGSLNGASSSSLTNIQSSTSPGRGAPLMSRSKSSQSGSSSSLHQPQPRKLSGVISGFSNLNGAAPARPGPLAAISNGAVGSTKKRFSLFGRGTSDSVSSGQKGVVAPSATPPVIEQEEDSHNGYLQGRTFRGAAGDSTRVANLQHHDGSYDEPLSRPNSRPDSTYSRYAPTKASSSTIKPSVSGSSTIDDAAVTRASASPSLRSYSTNTSQRGGKYKSRTATTICRRTNDGK